MKKILSALLISIAAQAMTAQDLGITLNIEASLPYTEFVAGEDVPLSVSINNPGASAFIIDDYPPHTANSLSLFLRSSDGRMIFPANDRLPLPACTIKPGETQAFTVNLGEFFNIMEEGPYQVSALAKRGKNAVSSHIVPFAVVRGIEIGAVTRMKEGQDNAAFHYTLLYWGRKDKEHLFLRITEKPSGRLYGFAQLGNIVRIAEPKINFEPANIVSVMHQTGRDRFVQTLLDVSGPQLKLVSSETLLSAVALREKAATQKAVEKINAMEDVKANEGGFFKKRTTRVKKDPIGTPAPSTGDAAGTK